ncbi:hypothetical protein CO670_14455 [Rhizobium sp. J15]|nr:hypothetical protein CO670_14455 [Rhizobium sp. J15]
MTTDRLDLRHSTVDIPRKFWEVRYNADRYPGAPGVNGVDGGANCQQYAYSILRHNGFEIPDLRSSDLWEDTLHTRVSQKLEPFDLLLVHREPKSFGAHVGLCVGENLILHLSRVRALPAVETLDELQRRDEYRFLIGFKTVLVRH